jgi:hypothetical protein
MDKVLCTYETKGNNRRVVVAIFESENGDCAIQILTKRLIDRKERKIISTNNVYGVETITVLHSLLHHLISENPLWNKKLHRQAPKPNSYKSNVLFTKE